MCVSKEQVIQCMKTMINETTFVVIKSRCSLLNIIGQIHEENIRKHLEGKIHRKQIAKWHQRILPHQ